jgi:hypothetical protein
VTHWCSPLSVVNANSPFAACIKSSTAATAYAEARYADCIMDVCMYTGMTTPNAPSAEDGACTVMTIMESYCQTAGVPLTGTWRNFTGDGFCVVTCNTNEQFSSCITAPTCAHPEGSLDPTAEGCTAACQCATGLVRDPRTNQCVSPSACNAPTTLPVVQPLPVPPRKPSPVIPGAHYPSAHEGSCTDERHHHGKHKSPKSVYDICTERGHPGQRWDECAYVATCDQPFAPNPRTDKCVPGCMCPRGWLPQADGTCARRHTVCSCNDSEHAPK